MQCVKVVIQCFGIQDSVHCPGLPTAQVDKMLKFFGQNSLAKLKYKSEFRLHLADSCTSDKGSKMLTQQESKLQQTWHDLNARAANNCRFTYWWHCKFSLWSWPFQQQSQTVELLKLLSNLFSSLEGSHEYWKEKVCRYDIQNLCFHLREPLTSCVCKAMEFGITKFFANNAGQEKYLPSPKRKKQGS